MRRKLVVAGGLVMLVLIAITATNSYLKTHTPTRSLSQKFIGYVLKNDASSSYALFSSSAQKAQNKEAWGNTVTTLSLVFKNKQPLYVSTATTSNQTVETYSITGVDNSPYTFVVSCQKEGGKWKVSSFLSKLSAPASTGQSSASSSGSGT